MLIKWSYSAEKDLEIIFQFYLKTSDNKVAKQIVNDIIYASNSLKL